MGGVVPDASTMRFVTAQMRGLASLLDTRSSQLVLVAQKDLGEASLDTLVDSSQRFTLEKD